VELDRVVRVRFPGRSVGSGYVITSRHVLTARHLAGKPPVKGTRSELYPLVGTGDLSSSRITAGPLSGTLEWFSNHPDRDLAIIEINAADEPLHDPQFPIVEFGRVPFAPTAWNCSATGFPKASGRDDRTIDAKVRWVVRGVRFDVDVASSIPRDWKKWAGFSGAVLFSEALALAVIGQVDEDWGGKLRATPVQLLLQDRDFLTYWERQHMPLPSLRLFAYESDGPPLDVGLATKTPPVGLDRFLFNQGWNDFVGREVETAGLLSFAQSDEGAPRLQFGLICGPAGQGKSRLALEVCQKATVSMHAGFLPRGKAPRHGWAQWQPAAPTFIVIDSASGRAQEIREILSDLTLPSRLLNHHVRVLILDREGGLARARKEGSNFSGFRTWIDTLIGGDPLDAQRIKAAFAFENVLEPVADPWAVMCTVFRARDVKPPERDGLMSALQLIDPNMSPLFAILVADSFASGAVQQGDRFQFLISTIHRPDLLPLEYELRENVLNLVAAATLTRGLDVLDLPDLFDALESDKLLAPFFRPRNDDLNIVLESATRLTGRRDGTLLFGLQPDLLGETLVLSRCQLDGNTPRRIETLRELAWRAGKPGQTGFLVTGEMLQLIARDFPAQLVDSGLLAPPKISEPAVIQTRAAALTKVVKVLEDQVSLDVALEFYKNLRAEATAPNSSPALQLARSEAASGLTYAILFKNLDEHHGLDQISTQRVFDPARTVAKFFADESRTAALKFYKTELSDPADRPNAPDYIQEERVLTAVSLIDDLMEGEDLERIVNFYRSEIRGPAERSNAEALWEARAHVAAVLVNRLKAKGLDAGISFYEAEMRDPANRPDACARVQEERAIVAAGLKTPETDYGWGFSLARDAARINLIHDISAEKGLDAALAFYDSELRAPAERSGASNILRAGRAKAAFFLLSDLVEAKSLEDALDFYAKELRDPAADLNVSSDMQDWRAKAAFDLTHDLLNAAFHRPKFVDHYYLQAALEFSKSELLNPHAIRLTLDRAVKLFDNAANELKRRGIPKAADVFSEVVEQIRSISVN
jgi:hypothetical protein